MGFKDNLKHDLDVVINTEEFAEEVIYRHPEEDLPLNAIFLSKNDTLFDREHGVDSTTPSILVKATDVPDVDYGSKFMVRNTEYEVLFIPVHNDMPLSASNSDLLRLYLSKDTKKRF